eukprot:CAMPEP_0181048718 /NCGR_PEP_ID=MMETSP1070-20121207/15583_2 /TAXON_ID=265543 /ORGANISM="Minutocellus polymorphus, Strain NH13" /LENGTH=71 /DNA_ID=CAMNT_0023127517 /DNA_START=1339 /DNA_END=1550 /DNA_ORIENTATION=-
MTKHERDQEGKTGLSPPLKAAKSDHDDAPRGASTAATDVIGRSFPRASAEQMAGRKVISGASAPVSKAHAL